MDMQKTLLAGFAICIAVLGYQVYDLKQKLALVSPIAILNPLPELSTQLSPEDFKVELTTLGRKLAADGFIVLKADSVAFTPDDLIVGVKE